MSWEDEVREIRTRRTYALEQGGDAVVLATLGGTWADGSSDGRTRQHREDKNRGGGG